MRSVFLQRAPAEDRLEVVIIASDEGHYRFLIIEVLPPAGIPSFPQPIPDKDFTRNSFGASVVTRVTYAIESAQKPEDFSAQDWAQKVAGLRVQWRNWQEEAKEPRTLNSICGDLVESETPALRLYFGKNRYSRPLRRFLER
jgi:hypothetical protein